MRENNKIRLLLLLKSLDGGTGTYFENLIEFCKYNNHLKFEICILSINKPNFRKFRHNSVNYFYTGKNRLNRKYALNFNNLSNLQKELLWLDKFVKNYNPDIVISSDSHSIILSEMDRILFRRKFKTISLIQNNIFKVLEYRLNNKYIKIIKLFLSYVFKKSDVLVTVSEKLSKDIFQNFKLKTIPTTLPFIYSNKYLSNGSERKLLNKNIITVSRLDKQKDVLTLIKSVQIAQKEISNLKLIIIGDGPQKKYLKKYISRNEIGNIKLLGWKQDPQKYLSNAAVFVLSSNWEGFPLSLIEAMSHGLPVIATNCKYGPEEILDKNKYGILVNQSDEYSMAKSIINLLDNGELWKNYSLKSLQRTKEYLDHYDYSYLEKIFNSLISN